MQTRKANMPGSVKHSMGGVLWLVLTAAAAGASGLPAFLVGGDISMLIPQEQAGVIYRDSQGQPKDLISLMTEAGCNCFRVRLFVQPTGRGGVIQDVPYAIALGRRIKEAGGVFLLDLHYSDTWADPAHQTKPAAWQDLPFDALVKTVQTYTAEVIARFKAEGVLPEIVQIGNEIHPGFLWPDGRLDGADSEGSWCRFTELLKAAIGGLRSAIEPEDEVRVMIHIACGGDFDRTHWFFSRLEHYGVPYDLIGQSYYPWWHGTMKELQDNLMRTAGTFKKDILVVETAYPNRPIEPFEVRADRKDAMVWPCSPQGQYAFLSELIETVRRTPNQHGRGVLWWYPESVPTSRPGGWYNGAMALFDTDGGVLPAMQAFSAAQSGRSGGLCEDKPESEH